jgi:RecA-family ATPase
MKDEEIDNVIRLAQKTAGATIAPISWIDMSLWDSEPTPEREWFIRDRIPVRQPTLFSGEGAVGKSLLTLQLLASTALGRDWLGLIPEPGGAWYLGAEDDECELRIRLDPILKHFGATHAHLIEGGFQMKSLFGEDALLGTPNGRGIIEPTPLFQQLFEEASDAKPKVIALDASADVFGGNEIDRSQVRQFVGAQLRKLAGAINGAVILLGHPSLTGINSGTGLSGSTAWHNSMRSRMYLTSPKPEAGEQPDTDLRELAFKKANYSRLAEPIILRWRDGLFLPEVGMSSIDKAAREMKADDCYLAALRKLVGQGHVLAPQRESTNYAPRLIARTEKAFRLSELEAAQQRLLDAGRIHIKTEGKPSRPVRRLFPGAPGA